MAQLFDEDREALRAEVLFALAAAAEFQSGGASVAVVYGGHGVEQVFLGEFSSILTGGLYAGQGQA